ncbi:MAG: D-alanyl-D-alanine carboxypeptidase [Myxococcaceae bacterium]|nr:D-alanyl-D-alanine carboxypeptidase [Myxococcaceae bacterium]
MRGTRFSPYAAAFVVATLLVTHDATSQAPAQSAPAASAAAATPAAGPLAAVVHDHAPDLEAAVRALANDSTFKDAQVAIAILDVDTGHLLASANEHMALNPASNAKVYTAAAALAMLHGDHRYETTLSGTAKNGEVTGPLVLRGHGDPSLTTADLFSLVLELHAHGIRRIHVDLVVDQHLFDETSTPPAFEQKPEEWASFRAPVSAVAVNENCVTMSVRPTTAGQPAQVSFDPPGFVDVDGTVTTGEDGADTVGLLLAGSGKRMSAKLSGSVGADAKLVRYTRRCEDPQLMPAYVLKALLDQMNIKVGGEIKAGTSKINNVLARHQSEPLSTLLYSLGKQSDNFYAEMIFKSLGGELKARPAKSAQGGEIVTSWLTKVGAMDTGVVVKNGSGLYDANRVTAASMVQVLRAAWRDPGIQPEFVAQLSIGGVDGTLHKRFRAERTRRAVRAKTGTLDDVIALTGYVTSPPGHGPIAFSILFNKVSGKGSGARAGADKLVEIIARRQWGD